VAGACKYTPDAGYPVASRRVPVSAERGSRKPKFDAFGFGL